MTQHLKAAALVAAAFVLPAGSADAATIEPDTFADGLAITGNCTLREAVQSATTNVAFDECAKGSASKADVIQLGEGEYDLTVVSLGDEDENFNGDLDYTGGGKLVITGPKPGKSYIDNNVDDRVIEASGDASSLTLKRLFIERGDVSGVPGADGGNIEIGEGRLVMNRVEVMNGTADDGGGGLDVSSDRSVRITKSYFADNIATQGGGVRLGPGESIVSKTDFYLNEAVGGGARGGALSALSGVRISDAIFLENTASADFPGSALGGAIYGVDMKIERSTFWLNATIEGAESVGADGGAIRAFDTTVTNSTFFDNASADDGGAFLGDGKLNHVTFYKNDAEGDGNHIGGPPVGADQTLAFRNSILPVASIFSDMCAESELVSKGFNVFGSGGNDCPARESDAVSGLDAGFKDEFPDGNGARTYSLDLAADSVAKDLVPIRKCGSSGFEDQRRFERPKGPRCDAGALERGAKP